MRLELDSILWETICICLEEEGVTGAQLDKAEEAIQYSLKETNYLHNSVADSNYYAAEERKEDKRIADLQNDLKKQESEHERQIESMRYELRQAKYRIEELQNKD